MYALPAPLPVQLKILKQKELFYGRLCGNCEVMVELHFVSLLVDVLYCCIDVNILSPLASFIKVCFFHSQKKKKILTKKRTRKMV